MALIHFPSCATNPAEHRKSIAVTPIGDIRGRGDLRRGLLIAIYLLEVALVHASDIAGEISDVDTRSRLEADLSRIRASLGPVRSRANELKDL